MPGTAFGRREVEIRVSSADVGFHREGEVETDAAGLGRKLSDPVAICRTFQ